MKYQKLVIMLVLIWTKSFSQEQIPTITVGAFENDNIKNFNPINNVTQNITDDLLENGFKVQILKSSGIQKIQQENGVPRFTDLTLDSSSTTIDYYTSLSGMGPKNGKLLLKLIKEKDERTLTLIVDATTTNKLIKEHSNDCKPMMDYVNNFGELPEYYDENKIVYVYDFNKDPSKREFYKITLDHDTLKRELVNFNKETLTSGKNVKFKIYNINKFMYNVSIADSVIHFDSEPPALFTRFFLGDNTLLESLMSTFSNDIKAQNSKEAESLIENISDFLTKYNKLKITALDALNPCHEFTCCNNDFDYLSFLNSLELIKAEAANVKRKLNEAKNDPTKKECNNQIKLKANAEYNIKTLNYEISKLNVRVDELNLQKNELSNTINGIMNEISLIESQVLFSKGTDSLTKRAKLIRLDAELISRRNELATNKIDLIELKKYRDTLNNKSYKYVASIDSIKNNISELCNNDTSNIDDMINVLEVSDYLINNLPKEDDLKKLIVFVNNMVNQNNSYTRDFISLNGNMLDLSINITSKDSIFKYFNLPEYKNDPIQIEIPIIGKPFVSFSSGSFIALRKNLQNKTYTWQLTVGNNNTAADTTFTIVESGFTLPPMGFCALGNLEWKVSRSFGLGGSAGVGLSIENSPRLSYLGGLSLFFGNLRQFTITSGFVGMQVNKLTNNFQTVADQQIIYSNPPTIEYYKEFKVGGFVSLTYTPFKIYKTKTTKVKND